MNRRDSFKAMVGLALAPSVATAASTFIAPPPAMIPIPFGILPLNQYIKGPRYLTMFGELFSERSTLQKLMMLEAEERRMLNEKVLDMLSAPPSPEQQAAINEINQYTHEKMREDEGLKQFLAVLTE